MKWTQPTRELIYNLESQGDSDSGKSGSSEEVLGLLRTSDESGISVREHHLLIYDLLNRYLKSIKC